MKGSKAVKVFASFLKHTVFAIVLSVLTQIGGLIYLVSILLIPKRTRKKNWVRWVAFASLYLLFTFVLVPKLAPVFGREKVVTHSNVSAQSVFFTLCNRNYVRPELNVVVLEVAKDLSKNYPDCKLVYLDANFPFWDGFPLFPHRSHNDGKKIDICFLYKTINGQATDKKRTWLGYGGYETPLSGELNQIVRCKNQGHWQYDATKYLSLGSYNENLKVDKEATKHLINRFVASPKVHKIFLEPHLKVRWQLKANKVRFHGCKAVRHDDHIHIEIR